MGCLEDAAFPYTRNHYLQPISHYLNKGYLVDVVYAFSVTGM